MSGRGFSFQLSPGGGGLAPPSPGPNPYALRQPNALGLTNPFGHYTEQEYAEGEEELKLLKQFFGYVMDPHKNQYVTPSSQVGDIYHVSMYLTDRNAFFGSDADYKSYLALAIGDLDADDMVTKGTGANAVQVVARVDPLRKTVDPNMGIRHGRWQEAQNVYYAWVRKAYENAGVAGADIPKVIRGGFSQALRTALKNVQTKVSLAGRTLGGFNPRPIKVRGAVKLGTISDHAFGNAIDVDAPSNAQIEQGPWAHIETYAGRSTTTNTWRAATWKSSPKDLYDAIEDTNQKFVTNLAADIVTHKSLKAAMSANKHLKALGAKWLHEWQAGFFALPWDVVREFHAAGFTWGAVFTTVDLHHFQV